MCTTLHVREIVKCGLTVGWPCTVIFYEERREPLNIGRQLEVYRKTFPIYYLVSTRPLILTDNYSVSQTNLFLISSSIYLKSSPLSLSLFHFISYPHISTCEDLASYFTDKLKNEDQRNFFWFLSHLSLPLTLVLLT